MNEPKPTRAWFDKANNRFEVKVLDPATGRYRKATGRTEAAAKAKAAELSRRLSAGADGDLLRVTVADYADRWVTRRETQLRRSTWLTQRSRIGVVCSSRVGSMRMADVRTGHVETLLVELAGRFSPSTVNETQRVLSALFADAVRHGLVDRNPCAGVRTQRIDSHGIEVLSVDELRATLSAARCFDSYPVLVLLAGVGLRLSEARGVRWSDLDLRSGFVSIERQLLRSTFGPPKTESSRRRCELPTAVTTYLSVWRERQPPVLPQWSGLVCTNGAGGPVPQAKVRTELRAAMAAAGVNRDRFGPHTLRHTFATQLLRVGTPLNVVSAHLGHADTAITLRTYQHLVPLDLGLVAASAARLLPEL